MNSGVKMEHSIHCRGGILTLVPSRIPKSYLYQIRHYKIQHRVDDSSRGSQNDNVLAVLLSLVSFWYPLYCPINKKIERQRRGGGFILQ